MDPGELNSLLYKFQYTRENSAGPLWRGVNYWAEPKRDGEVELWMTRFHDRGARKRRMPPHVVVLCALYWVLGSEKLGDEKGDLIGL